MYALIKQAHFISKLFEASTPALHESEDFVDHGVASHATLNTEALHLSYLVETKILTTCPKFKVIRNSKYDTVT